MFSNYVVEGKIKWHVLTGEASLFSWAPCTMVGAQPQFAPQHEYHYVLQYKERLYIGI